MFIDSFLIISIHPTPPSPYFDFNNLLLDVNNTIQNTMQSYVILLYYCCNTLLYLICCKCKLLLVEGMAGASNIHFAYRASKCLTGPDWHLLSHLRVTLYKVIIVKIKIISSLCDIPNLFQWPKSRSPYKAISPITIHLH